MSIPKTILAVVMNLCILFTATSSYSISNLCVGWYIDQKGSYHTIDSNLFIDKNEDNYEEAYLCYIISKRLIIEKKAQHVILLINSFDEKTFLELDALIKGDGMLSADSDNVYYYIAKAWGLSKINVD